MSGDPFDLSSLPGTPIGRAALAVVRPCLDRVLGLREIGRLYRLLPSTRRPSSFEAAALETLGITLDCPSGDLASLPTRGPAIVAANHPHGIADGLALATLVGQVRSDVRILANYLLAAVPEMRESCFFVDPFGSAGSAERSRAGLRAAHLWLRQGGALVVFPAGEVAHRWEGGRLRDEPWQPTVGRLAEATGATIVPAFVEGHNNRLFYAAGRVHPLLRTALLGRELLGQRGRPIRVQLGEAVVPATLAPSSGQPASAAALVSAARQAVDALTDRPRVSTRVGDDEAAGTVANELARLDREACLIASGAFKVYCAEAAALPATLQELGRLREQTFRAVGEGTGRAVDLDEFDATYLHLVLWDDEARQVVGAYRMGRTDLITARSGVEGLYTRTLFAYDRSLIDRLGPALELGRSFVREEYQRNHNALLLLWKGIGRYVSTHPRYRVLFGPVSISARYSDRSHALLMKFLEQNHRHEALADLVRAIDPMPSRGAPEPGPSVVPCTAEEASRLVAALEPDGKGMPVLLRQYLKLNARVLAFNVDPKFGHALDALMTVDLTTVDRAILNRYLGKEEAARLLAVAASAQAA
jgi:putative hemolysin